MYSLARRFTRWPLTTALLLIFTPGFLVISHTLMGNLPGLALVLAGAALYIHGVDRGSWKLLAASVAALILTGLTAFQALSVVPALLLYGATHRPGAISRLPAFHTLGGRRSRLVRNNILGSTTSAAGNL